MTVDRGVPTQTEEKPKKRHKYGANKTEVDGIVFDSAKEAKRYKELKLLLKAGSIGLLERQVRFQLNNGGQFSYEYVADFVYLDHATGKKVVEDAKGFRTKEYLKKKRLMKKLHNIQIKEV
ncbi:MAG TPA: hypothetical protein DCQ29_02005 [Chitinophagaceae bacterium]|nr:hypothetical protein [Chitinophagaceae bacterium]